MSPLQEQSGGAYDDVNRNISFAIGNKDMFRNSGQENMKQQISQNYADAPTPLLGNIGAENHSSEGDLKIKEKELNAELLSNDGSRKSPLEQNRR